MRGADCGACGVGTWARALDLQNCQGRSWPIDRPFMTYKVFEKDLMSLLGSSQNRGIPLIRIGQILARGPCAGKVNEILLGMTAKTERERERERERKRKRERESARERESERERDRERKRNSVCVCVCVCV